MTIAANIYCTIEDVKDVLSIAGVSLAVDDNPPSMYAAALSWSGNQVDFYLWGRYDLSALQQCDLVKDWAKVVAAYFLRTRRGNPAPAGIAIMYKDAVAQMKLVKLGLQDLPNVGVRSSLAPAMSKMRSTLVPCPRAVVETSQGTHLGGAPAGYHQHRDPWDAFGWNADAFMDWSF